MFRSMSNEHDHDHPPQFQPPVYQQPQRLRFTFRGRLRRTEIYDGVIGSQIVGDLFMLTFEGGRAIGVPIAGRRVLIEGPSDV